MSHWTSLYIYLYIFDYLDSYYLEVILLGQTPYVFSTFTVITKWPSIAFWFSPPNHCFAFITRTRNTKLKWNGFKCFVLRPFTFNGHGVKTWPWTPRQDAWGASETVIGRLPMGCILDFRVVVEQEEVGVQEGSVSIINCTLEGFPLAVRYVDS